MRNGGTLLLKKFNKKILLFFASDRFIYVLTVLKSYRANSQTLVRLLVEIFFMLGCPTIAPRGSIRLF